MDAAKFLGVVAAVSAVGLFTSLLLGFAPLVFVFMALTVIPAIGSTTEYIRAREPKELDWDDTKYVKMIHKTIEQETEVYGEAKTVCHCPRCKADAEKALKQLDYALKAGSAEALPVKAPQTSKPWMFSKEVPSFNREYFFKLPGDISVEDAESYSVFAESLKSARLARHTRPTGLGYQTNYWQRVSDSMYSRPIGCTCREIGPLDAVSVYSDEQSKPIFVIKPAVKFVPGYVGDCPACEKTKNCERHAACKCDTCVAHDVKQMNTEGRSRYGNSWPY